ncbi:hypothetical protein PAECIP111890_02114 [Paenibacillus sp. JJ-223]|nr:hypothetical protein PAECIP111890_02114 [Paenibacillus sp. JJ-223]
MDDLSIWRDAMVRLRNADLRMQDVKGKLFIDQG